jgi:hypothetical protein
MVKKFVELPEVKDLFEFQEACRRAREQIYQAVVDGRWKAERVHLIARFNETTSTPEKVNISFLINTGDSDYRILKSTGKII